MRAYESSPRNGWVIIHHAGSPNSHQVYDDRYCESGYDFTVDRSGHVYVCRNNADTFYRWTRKPPAGEVWHASGCDCQAIGIQMHGCFGGCASGNVNGPSFSQKCTVASIMYQLNMPTGELRVRPHAACHSWNPCDHPSPITTVCPGSNFTDSNGWDSNGITLRDDLRAKRQNMETYGCCNPPCPT